MYERIGYLKEKFRLFHLKDKSDKTYDFHYHDFSKIIFFLDGDVKYIIEGKTYELKPYDIVLVPKNEIHKPCIGNDREYERIVLYLAQSFFDDDRLKGIFDLAKENHTNVLRLSPKDNTRVFSIMKEAFDKWEEGKEFSDLYSKLLVTEALLMLNESVKTHGFIFEGSVMFNERIVKACEYINTHLHEDLNVDRLSRMFFLSKYHFMRLFKEATGYSVHQYVLEKRILYTEALAESGEKITRACLMAGFKDYSIYLRAKKNRN